MDSCRCVVCERILKSVFPDAPLEGSIQPKYGGEFELRFDYGSVHDLCVGMPGNPIDRYVGVLCDDCFDKKMHCLQPIRLIPTRTEVEHGAPHRELTEQEKLEQANLHEYLRKTFDIPKNEMCMICASVKVSEPLLFSQKLQKYFHMECLKWHHQSCIKTDFEKELDILMQEYGMCGM